MKTQLLGYLIMVACSVYLLNSDERKKVPHSLMSSVSRDVNKKPRMFFFSFKTPGAFRSFFYLLCTAFHLSALLTRQHVSVDVIMLVILVFPQLVVDPGSFSCEILKLYPEASGNRKSVLDDLACAWSCTRKHPRTHSRTHVNPYTNTHTQVRMHTRAWSDEDCRGRHMRVAWTSMIDGVCGSGHNRALALVLMFVL